MSRWTPRWVTNAPRLSALPGAPSTAIIEEDDSGYGFILKLYDKGQFVAWLSGSANYDDDGSDQGSIREPFYNFKIAKYFKGPTRGMLEIRKVVVLPQARGRGYSAVLISEAVRRYRKPGTIVWAEVGSQVIYAAFRKILGTPKFACRVSSRWGGACMPLAVTDESIRAELSPTPEESEKTASWSFTTMDTGSVAVFWK